VDEARSAIVDFLFSVPELVERVIFDLRTVPDCIAFGAIYRRADL
jgi:hypothetical protein